MARLAEQLSALLARVEILAAGAEPRLQDALRALEGGRPWEARYEALAILDQLPRSRVALALWADAAETTLLDHEAVEALERLAREVPFRADVWLRLGAAHARLGIDPRAALERAAESSEPVEAADAARLELADRDLGAGDPARAERWLDQLSLGARGTPMALARRIEVWLDSGETERALEASGALPAPGLLDARGWLVRGRLDALSGLAAAVPAFTRALVLGAPGAVRVITAQIARSTDVDAMRRLETVARDLGIAGDAEWRAAFAQAAGRPAEALDALREAAETALDAGSASRYLAGAVAARDAEALEAAVRIARAASAPVDAAFVALLAALKESGQARLAALDRAIGPARPWAAALRTQIYEAWWPSTGRADWSLLLGEIGELARKLGVLDALRAAEAIAVDLERPLRVAVVGEFNAGKSTFINALLGEDVAPVGVLPTTATLNQLVWAPDRFARIARRPGTREPDRIVGHGELRRTLAMLDPSSIERVVIYAPLEPLRRVEIVDTPGFNAPGVAHSDAARRALSDAHAALFLLDATQPFKDSERAVLAEIHELGVPVVVLVNKLDRLSDAAAVERVIEHVARGLRAENLSPENAPLALSARLALAGRTGDDGALATSRWGDVERLVETALVGRAPELRERVLRRRALEIAVRLNSAAAERSAETRLRSEALALQNAGLRRLADRASRERRSLEHTVSQALETALGDLSQDLRPVSGFESDPAAERFVSGRVRARLGRVLTEAAIGWAASDFEGSASAAAEVMRQLRPRIEAGAAMVAPWLGASGSASSQERSRRPEELPARRRLVELVAEELCRVAAEGSALRIEAPETAVGARTSSLLAVLKR